MKRQCRHSSRFFSRQTRFLLLGASVLLAPAAVAQTDYSPIAPPDTSSPRATLRSFIDACNDTSELIRSQRYLNRDLPQHRPVVRRVVDCLDVSTFPSYARDSLAAEAAVCIKEILDRVELPPYDEIPGAKEIGKPDESDQIKRWRVPGTRLTIAQVEEGPQRLEWLFTAGSVSRARDNYYDMKSRPYRKTPPATSPGLFDWYVSAPGNATVGAIVERLPDWTRTLAWGVSVWKWIGLIIALPMGLLIMAILYRLQRTLVRRCRGTSTVLYLLTICFPIAAALVPLFFDDLASSQLAFRGAPLYAISFASNMTALLAFIVVVFVAANRIAELFIASPQINPQGLDAQFIRIVSKMLGLVLGGVIFLAGGQYLGIPITTLLASAGVGGLAIALAAQDTLKNVFGTILLMADKPFRVGERIVFKNYDGFVEDIGLRSTRLRLLTGNLVTVPNDELARNDVENVDRRPHIRRTAELRLPLNTPGEKVARAVEIVREALDDHEGMNPDNPPRVFFNEFNAESFNIRAIYWYHPADYWMFLAFSEKLNLEICRAFEAEGIRFSLPLRIAQASADGRETFLGQRVDGAHEG